MKEETRVWLNEVLPKEFTITQPGQVKVLAGGSDRTFMRVPGKAGSVVVMHSTGAEDEFDQYLAIQHYLAERGLGVPELYYADPAGKVAVLEDLGDDSLGALARYTKGDELMALYQQVIKFLVGFQVKGYADHTQCEAIDSRSFDHTMLRWETWYFRVYFLEQYCGLERSLTRGLTNEFEELASGLAGGKQLLMHRDFQSQNIFIKDGQVRIVDFQAAQKGIPTYDLAALVRDAYVALPFETGNKLMDYYRSEMVSQGGISMEDGSWHQLVVYASLQRVLQILGAFSFLSLVKGKDTYRQYIRPALGFLTGILSQQTRFPKLTQVITKEVPPAIKD